MSAVFQYAQGELAAGRVEPPTFAWDQWASTDYYFVPADGELKKLEGISGKGICALATAVGECLCALLYHADRRTEALQYFDAAWVGQIDPRRCEFVELDRVEWAGPANGALRAGIMIVNDAIFEAPNDLEFALRGCWALNLLRHVVGNRETGVWQRWIDAVVANLHLRHSDSSLESDSIFSHRFTFGEPVGPSLFTLDRRYSAATAKGELLSHLAGLREENPYLAQHT